MTRVLGLFLAAMPPAAIFLAQTWLVAAGQSEMVLALAKHAGLLALLFFAFDGNSGLAPALMRLRHDDANIRTAFLVYRGAVMIVLAALLPLAWHWDREETSGLLPFCAAALLLRLLCLDADLDRKNLQHWSMLLQNLWMLPLAAVAVGIGKVDAQAAGHCALWSSAVYSAVHFRIHPPMRWAPISSVGAPLREICHLMAANGIGQLYGRGVLFVIGTSFAGPVASLVVYAKQLFNASGIVVGYLRRVELQDQGTPSMRLSLLGQAVITIVGSVILALAAQRLAIAPTILAAVILWQVAEKLSSTEIYSFQTVDRHNLAFAGLMTVVALGSAGLLVATLTGALEGFLAGETLAFALVLLLWAINQRHLFARSAAS